ncbi:MAG: ribosome maturation factor RimP [Candidatus Omnitrophota bacterium]|jgi:ribosome maturation factor RimP
MYRDSVILELRGLIEEHLKGQGLFLVDLICRREGRNLMLRVLVDYPLGGIDIDTCARLNNELGAILEEKDIIGESYILEVSSPGLDRSLKSREDFRRCLGREAVFYLSGSVKERIEWRGVIKEIGEDGILIESSGDEISIPLALINKARQIV